MRLRAILFVSVLVLSGPVVVARTDATQPPACDDVRHVDGLGPACPAPGGWRVVLADGTTLLTHGPDPKPSETAPGLGENSTASYPPWPPACAPTTQKHVLLVYMVPSDATDRYSTFQPKLRDMVNRINGHLRLEAQIFGDDMSYRFACDPDGQVHVERVLSSVASTTQGDATFSALVNDLRAKGYKSTNAKYLVHWDAQHCCYGGVGNVHNDDRLVSNNANNGGPDYAINYGNTGGWGLMTMSHELGHNIGAVQLSAPHSTGGYHCTDGQDTMCYKDGPDVPYNGNVCTDREHYDCGHDDYFNPTPAPGTYLASHWNLASRLNVWFDFTPRPNQPPTIQSLTCLGEPSSPNETTTCNVRANDPDLWFNSGGGNLTYTFDWGDGTPPTTIGPYNTFNAIAGTHAWTHKGNYTVTVVATDDGSPQLASDPFAITFRVECDVERSGQILVGLAGLDTPATARTHALPDCGGSPYKLTSSGSNDFDVCWHAGTTVLRCDVQPGNNAGTVPEGATEARVVLARGALALYRLHVGSG